MAAKRRIVIMAVTAALVVCLAGVAPATASMTVDHSIFDRLLARHVSNGVVDYKGFQQDEKQLDAYLALLARVDPDQLERNERFAFYINLYNAWTIKLVLSRYPDLHSIKDLGSWFKSPWQKKIVKLNGRAVTLDHIEHDILRPQFKDARVHFAINCASKSCPPLMARAYTGADLDQQLDQAARAFINDGHNNYLKGRTLYLSRIFKWFGEDFKPSVVDFVLKYAQGDFARGLREHRADLKIEYLEYDWSLNSR